MQLTHWGRDKLVDISQTTFSNVFSSIKMLEFRLKFLWSLFLKVPIKTMPALMQIMAWCRPGEKPLSEPLRVRLPPHICVTRPQWIKEMLPCARLNQLHWRHNDHDGVSNHQPRCCLLNRLFGRRSKKISKLRVTGLCAGNSPGPVTSPHKGPVTRKMFPFDDVIMQSILSNNSWWPSPFKCWSHIWETYVIPYPCSNLKFVMILKED